MSHRIWYISVISTTCGFQEVLAIDDICITQIISGCGEGQHISAAISKAIKAPVTSATITDEILTEYFGEAMMLELAEQDTFDGFDPEAILHLAKSSLTRKQTTGEMADPWFVTYASPTESPGDDFSSEELITILQDRPDIAYAVALKYADLQAILESQGYELNHPNLDKTLTLITDYYGTENGIIQSMLNLAIDHIEDLGLQEQSNSIQRTYKTYSRA